MYLAQFSPEITSHVELRGNRDPATHYLHSFSLKGCGAGCQFIAGKQYISGKKKSYAVQKG